MVAHLIAGIIDAAQTLNVGMVSGQGLGDINASGNITAGGDMVLADAKALKWSDVNLYRGAADVLKTDDSLIVAGGLNLGSAAGAGTGCVMLPNSSGSIYYGQLDSAGGGRAILYLGNENPDVLHIRNNQRSAGGTINFETKAGAGVGASLNNAGTLCVTGGLNLGGATGAAAGQIKCQDLTVVGSAGNISIPGTGAWLNFSRPNINYIAATAVGGYLAFDVNGDTAGRMTLSTAGHLSVSGGLNVNSTGAAAGAINAAGAVTAAGFCAGSGAGSYTHDILAATGADRNLARFGVTGYSNGLTIQYTNSPQGMVYTMANGKLGVGVTPAEVIHSSAKVRANTVFNCNGTDGVTGNIPIANAVSGYCNGIAVKGGLIIGWSLAP